MSVYEQMMDSTTTERLINAYREAAECARKLMEAEVNARLAQAELREAKSMWPRVQDGRNLPARVAVESWDGKYLVIGDYVEGIYVVTVEPLLDVVDVKL